MVNLKELKWLEVNHTWIFSIFTWKQNISPTRQAHLVFPCQPTADRLSSKVGGVQGKERAQGKGQGRIVGVGCNRNGAGLCTCQSTKGEPDEPEIRAPVNLVIPKCFTSLASTAHKHSDTHTYTDTDAAFKLGIFELTWTLNMFKGTSCNENFSSVHFAFTGNQNRSARTLWILKKSF